LKDTRVARRYAGALFAVAQRDGILDSVAQDLTLVGRFLAEVPYLRAVLLQPLVSDARKNAVVDEAFGDRVTASTLNFLKLLVRKQREGLIGECIAEFRALLAEHTNTLDAEAWTAVPMTLEQQERLVVSLHRLTGKKVRLTAAVDHTLVGGVVVRLGDTVIDGSVRGKLERLERQLLGSGALGGTV
jgi:F-type H+-transporting ATPase subunit delta